MHIDEKDCDKVLSYTNNKILEIITADSQPRRVGASYIFKCPKCGSNHLTYTPGKGVFKCFACNEVKGKRAIDYVMTAKNLSYPEAIKYLANFFSVLIEVKQDIVSRPRNGKKLTFCDRMLADSGLTKKDVTATVIMKDDNSTLFKSLSFEPGTINEKGLIDKSGDDVIINYYDLEGFPIMFTPNFNAKLNKKNSNPTTYYRVRWQFPNEHKDSKGRPSKYKSPAGSSTQIYIPQIVRNKYKKKEVIDRLFIQEGEKKAEKACKHGIISVGISGIQNFGYKGVFPEEVARIVTICEVREIVFILDSDCFDLSDNLTINDPIDRRPRNFFYAVKNFKEYIEILKNRGIYLECYFGHINKNEAKDKGVDDLLTNSLKGKEQLLHDEINFLMNEKNKIGKFISLYKITTMSDNKLLEIWNLNSVEKFCDRYREQLVLMPEFVFGKNRMTYNEDGNLVSAQPLEPEERFWKEIIKKDKNGNEYDTDYRFFYEGSLIFLRNRGYGKYKDNGVKKIFVHNDNKVITTVDCEDIRDFVVDFTRYNLNINVLEMLHSGGPQFLGDFRLSSLMEIELNFCENVKNLQYLYFKDYFWMINENEIKINNYTQLPHNIWREQKSDFTPTLLPDLFSVSRIDGKLRYTISEVGKKCDFLQFLINTSNFTWKKTKLLQSTDTSITDDIYISDEEKEEDIQHFVAKLCAIGYMATAFKDPSTTKIVVGLDGEQSEIGASNGRTGKSLVGELMKQITPVVAISGKNADPIKDPFIWDSVSEKTRLVFIDDIRINFSMESIFPNASNDWTVNYKGGARVTLPYYKSPKIYVTSNHMLSGSGTSYSDRTWNIAFSDWYNDKHKPKDDFGSLFFVEWDYQQWNLCWNMVAQCIKLYFKIGVVESPGEKIAIRKLRQEMGENFLLWAEEYFSDESRLNIEIARKELFNSLIEYMGSAAVKYYTPNKFKRSIENYCLYKGYILNPQKYDPVTNKAYKYKKDGSPDIDDKRCGVEYFTIGSVIGTSQQSLFSGVAADDDDDDFTLEIN